MQWMENVTVRFLDMLCTSFSIKRFVFFQRDWEEREKRERERALIERYLSYCIDFA